MKIKAAAYCISGVVYTVQYCSDKKLKNLFQLLDLVAVEHVASTVEHTTEIMETVVASEGSIVIQ